MDIVRRIHAMKEVTRKARARGKKIGFVPTMGYLHEGHLGLIRRVRDLSDLTVVSIFVNPTQFGPEDDFARYPRDLVRDTDLCIREGVTHLFTPETEEMYPPDSRTFVEVEGLSSRLEGASRPGHFRGVTTVVLKLVEIVQPHVVAFGQKDAQQAIIIQRMARDLMLDAQILVRPTVRDEDGLALSSRNTYLSPDERRAALAVPRSLEAAEAAFAAGEWEPERIVEETRKILDAEAGLRVDYVELVDTVELQPVVSVEQEMLLAVAVYAGRTRLIDNTIIRI